MKLVSLTSKTNWKVGLIPAVICGITVYVLTRYYFNDGCKEGIDFATSAISFGNKVQEKINLTKGI